MNTRYVPVRTYVTYVYFTALDLVHIHVFFFLLCSLFLPVLCILFCECGASVGSHHACCQDTTVTGGWLSLTDSTHVPLVWRMNLSPID